MTLLGAGFGAALFWLTIQLRPPRVDPLVQLGRLYAARGRAARGESGSANAGMQARLGGWLADELGRRGIGYRTLRQDTAINGESFELTMGRKALLALGGFLFGVLCAVLIERAALTLPTGAVVVIGLGLAGLFYLVPDLEARQSAARRRREFRRALGAYLDWVSLQMSGRAAAEQALPDAARLGAGWPFALIRHTVLGSTRAGRNVWDALAELGDRIGIRQLRELGALVRLVAHDGAQVRDTLTARAASLRAEELAEAQGNAGKRDQSMLLAQALLGVGFAVFLGYPAVVSFLAI